MKLKIQYFLIYYALFLIVAITLGITLGLLINGQLYSTDVMGKSFSYAKKILYVNSINFFLYVLMPFLAPILQLNDMIQTFFDITISIKNSGISYTLENLLPHALLEFPNMLLYQGISQWIFFNFIIEKRLKSAYLREKKYIKEFVGSFIILIIAAFVEGLWG